MSDPTGRYVERMGAALASVGLPRSPARVFAALTADEQGRMTSADLVETLGLSPGSVSGAVRYLTQVGFIHRERDAGSRRDVYVVDDDAWLRAMLTHDQVYAPILAVLDDALRRLDPDTRTHRRLGLMKEFMEYLGHELDEIARRWLAHRAEADRDLG